MVIRRKTHPDNERDIRAVKGNHFEKLAGRKGEYSIRLNQQWRLTGAFATRDGVKTVVLLRIEDYHSKRGIQ